ncbi:DUF7521 family protein [Halogranum rubrum]|uniref:YapH protein n=1 Tax=Halogranum salarium B-1 TaxID=1210908 RepID=J2Z9X4_9EURY|nr:hypothetical protein [Halogranum salarium]EJN57450.1 hypothetical protein HSB1_41380 [Halogranum salarium B-1]
MHLGLVAAKLVVIFLGLLIAYQGFRAYRREQSHRMLFVAAGFALITVGSVLEGVLYDIVHLSVFVSGMVQTGFVAAGMALILYSLFVTRESAQSERSESRSSNEQRHRAD